MSNAGKIFSPARSLGHVSNHIPLQVRYIKSRKENLIVTCVGKAFHTYGISHFGLLSVSALHSSDITSMTADAYHVYTSCNNEIYAWRRGTELKHIYRGHTKPVHLMIPFGIHLISVDEHSQLRIWDIKEETVHLQMSFSNDLFKITTILHPSTYINKILFGSEQGQMQLWNINKVKLVYNFKGWDTPITCLEQAPAIDVAAIGLNSGRIILHNLKYDETIMDFVQDWGSVTSISFRTDGSPIMACGSAIGHITFWDLENRQVSTQLLKAHEGPVTGMVALSNEPLLVTSSPDNTLKLWIFDLTDGGARLLRIREGHSLPPSFIRFYGLNGENILSAGEDSTLRIFNIRTEQFNKSLGKASYNRKISKKCKRIVNDPLIMPPIIEFTSEVTREKEWDNVVAIHAGLRIVTTWSYDKLKMGEVKLIPEKSSRPHMNGENKEIATCLHISHCGSFVIVGYSTGYVDRFNVQSGIWRGTYGKPKAHTSAVRGVTTDSLNKLTISGGSDCKLKFWHFKSTGTEAISTLLLEEAVQFFRTHVEGSLLAIALEDFCLILVDIYTRTIVRKFVGHSAQLTDAAFSPDSRWIITSSMDCTIRVWDIPLSHLIDQFKVDVACVSLCMSPTGEILATAHVDSLGLFLWCNRTLYAKITLTALSPNDDIPTVSLPECYSDESDNQEQETEIEKVEFMSPQQISHELVTLSGLAGTKWQNLLNIDIIRQRNKPKSPPKALKAAPFFLPTTSSLNFKFDFIDRDNKQDNNSKLLKPADLLSLSPFGKLLHGTITDGNFDSVIEKLKTFGPSMIEFELKSLTAEEGGSVTIMLQFIKCIEYMLKSNTDFELAEAYLGLFLKIHGNNIASENILRKDLLNIQSCHGVSWDKVQEKLLYNLCVIENLKSM